MKFKLYRDVKEFYGETHGIMMRHEAQNMIPLGNLIVGNEGRDKTDWRDPENWFMATVSDEHGALLTAIMTPPYNLTLYATDNIYDSDVLTCLIRGIKETEIAIGGVMTESSLAEGFAQAYSAETGMNYEITQRQRLYELRKVNPDIPLVGNIRIAGKQDMSFLPYWFEAFDSDCFGSIPAVKKDPEPYLYHISDGNLFILEEVGMPVSMAKISREMQTVAGVSYVYTPPYLRGRGYATSCVAMLSRLILERGFSKCVLYTDLANPTSNSIYQKIGYEPICDSLEIKFN